MPWRRTPRWISLGGACLSLTSGFVNALGYLGLAHRGVSHVTGQVTQLGVALGRGDAPDAWSALSLIVAFVLGACISGAIIHTTEITRGSQARYGVALSIESALLIGGAFMMWTHQGAAELPVAVAMGLQNAMASSYSGAIVRTTHVTGIATDVGALLGQWLRGPRPEAARLRLLVLLLGCFLAGGFVGGIVFRSLGDASLFVPAAFVSLAAIGFVAVGRAGSGAPSA